MSCVLFFVEVAVMQDNDMPKYKKKSKTIKPKKANHKHDYSDEVLLKEAFACGVSLHTFAVRCVICGKIMRDFLFESVRCEETGFHRMLSEKEKLDKYKHLKIVEIDWKTGEPI